MIKLGHISATNVSLVLLLQRVCAVCVVESGMKRFSNAVLKSAQRSREGGLTVPSFRGMVGPMCGVINHKVEYA